MTNLKLNKMYLMKIFVICSILVSATLGCKQVKDDFTPPTGLNNVKIGVDLSSASMYLATRGAQNDTVRFRLSYELNGGDGFSIKKDTLFSIASSIFEMDVQLDKGSYTLALFGDYVIVKDGAIVKEHFIVDKTEGLKKVSIAFAETDEPWKMAYSGMTNFGVSNKPVNTTVTIKRCVAKISFENSSATTDLKAKFANYRLKNFATIYNVHQDKSLVNPLADMIAIKLRPITEHQCIHEVTIFETKHPFQIEYEFIDENDELITFPPATSDFTREDITAARVYGDFPANTTAPLNVQVQPYVFGTSEPRLFGFLRVPMSGDEWIFKPKESSELMVSDSLALVDLFNSLHGNKWTQSWHLYVPAKNWAGVTIEKIDGVDRVTELTLGLENLYDEMMLTNNVFGEIPKSIDNLTELKTLQIGGVISRVNTDFSTLPHLEYLTIHNEASMNGVSITYPDIKVKGLTKLLELKLVGVNILECDPISNNNNLAKLYIENRNTSNLDYSQVFKNCSQLTQLKDFRWENIRSHITTLVLPHEFYSLSQIENIRLSGFYCDIKRIAESFTNCHTLWLFNIPISQMLPKEIGNLKSLREIAIQGCNLYGVMPSELGNLSALEFLTFTSNDLTGEIPKELGKLTNLQWLHIPGNRLKGEVPEWLLNSKYWSHWSVCPQQEGYGFTNCH